MPDPKRKIYGTLNNASAAAQIVFSENRAAGTAYGCSDEQIFSPVEISQTNWGYIDGVWSNGPSFGIPWSWTWSESGNFGGGTVGPTIEELNPYYSNVLDNFFDGVDFVHVVNSHPEGDLNISNLSSSPSAVYTTGLRGPLILSGWGYDVSDRPVPSSDGVTHDEGMQGDRSTWKSGPVNLQWDEQRQVWQGGPQIVCGTVLGSISAPSSPCYPTTFEVRLLRPEGAGLSWYLKAKEVSGSYNNWWGDGCEEITVTNRDPSLEEVANDGMIFCIAVRINYEWLPIWIGCPDVDAVGNTACSNC